MTATVDIENTEWVQLILFMNKTNDNVNNIINSNHVFMGKSIDELNERH